MPDHRDGPVWGASRFGAVAGFAGSRAALGEVKRLQQVASFTFVPETEHCGNTTAVVANSTVDGFNEDPRTTRRDGITVHPLGQVALRAKLVKERLGRENGLSRRSVQPIDIVEVLDLRRAKREQEL